MHTARPDSDTKNPPDWVVRGGGWATVVSGKRAFYGVGIASHINDRSMLIESADTRARVEIAKIFSVFMQSVYSEQQHAAGAAVAERNISAGTEAVLSGTLIKERWTDTATGELYSLAILDLDWAVDNIGKSQLSEQIKDSVRERATPLFDRISK
jgi:hypothetical protein